jgi:hypothetical protein
VLNAAAFAALFFAFMSIFIAILLGMAIERNRMRREAFDRECELAGLKASHTNPNREIVI